MENFLTYLCALESKIDAKKNENIFHSRGDSKIYTFHGLNSISSVIIIK